MLASGAQTPSHTINVLIASGVWWFVAKYSGAIQTWLSRALYSYYCHWLIGGATGFLSNVKLYFVCKQPLEDFSNNPFSYSQQFLGFLFAGVAYWISHQFQRLWYRVRPIAQAGATIDDPAGREIYLKLITSKLKQTKENLRDTQNRLREKEDELSETQNKLSENESELMVLRATLLQSEIGYWKVMSAITDAQHRVAKYKTRI